MSVSVYCEELSNSVQSIDLHGGSSAFSNRTTDTLTGSEDSEESSIEKAIQVEAGPILPPGYQLSHCLAEGCMGRVFLVVNPQTKDCLAAKVVNVLGRCGSASVLSPEKRAAKLRAELRTEAELQRRLKHHNIATVYGIRNTQTFTFMFMELLPGGELFERIPIGVGLHVQQMFIYYAQILDALNYLHKEQFIAHLDVKPENIMLTKKDRAKLIDFGWAVDLRKNNMLQGPVGTTNYAAPEVFGKGCYTGPPADLFSLGVTLLTAVTGQRCWTRANPQVDTMYSQWTDRRNLHSGPVFSRLPPDLTNFLTRALAHRPGDRLTVEEIRAHPWFRRGLARRLTPVSPPTSTSSSTKSPRHLSNAPVSFVPRKSPVPFFNSSNPTVPSSQPISSSFTQTESVMHEMHLSQPADIASMLMASQAVYDNRANPEDVRLSFSCLMKRMTRFFSALSSLEHTMEVIRAVIVQQRQLRATSRGPGNLLVQIRNIDGPGTVFRVLLYPLAGSILADWRRVSGDGLLFHQTYAALYVDLVAMGAVNESHPYLRIILPERPVEPETAKDVVVNTESATEGSAMDI
ncbi:Non-specific serine/threonine protein kinase [Fasciola hepatica]|uniref:non-specific serine/threonine protein kinase n=1 Tax=Fasciola hepatica TaxID=6192 RepID=A0A4E0S2V8_FASHE|nr:Non-specific serine/threonine protein kinase [Fasciola hepatica]